MNSSDYIKLFEQSPALYSVRPHFNIVTVTDAYLKTTMTEREKSINRSI
jgi:hypothetical protein